MDDNVFSYGQSSYLNCSQNEIVHENDDTSYASFDADRIEDVTDFEKHVISNKQNLEKRLQELQQTMVSLKEQLTEEKTLWKQQLEEVLQEINTNKVEYTEVEQTTGVPETFEILQDTKSYSTITLSSNDYEEKLSHYEDALVKAHAEKRANLRRQISINNYKRRLLEVENMCNLELLRVKQSVQFLQPLQMMASEWKTRPPGENMISDEEISGTISKQESQNENKREAPHN